MDLIVASGLSELAEARADLMAVPTGHAVDRPSLALVPTMGALHEGHRSLMRLARERADLVAVSIFVNPLQFGPNEDFSRYPRTFDADLEVCAEEGVGLVFAPSAREMYPPGRQVGVAAGPMGDLAEGVFRPGHFDGVLTVVLKLFNLVRPDVAVFGRKDVQQLTLIRRMVTDLDLPITIAGAPTVREPDGLALSSRNRYLSAEDRAAALALSAALRAGAAAAAGGAEAVLAAAQARLHGLAVDYLALTDPALGPAPEQGEARLLVAARIGPTRLIDNTAVTLGVPPA